MNGPAANLPRVDVTARLNEKRAVRRVDVMPESQAFAEIGDRLKRIDGAGVRRPRR